MHNAITVPLRTSIFISGVHYVVFFCYMTQHNIVFTVTPDYLFIKSFLWYVRLCGVFFS